MLRLLEDEHVSRTVAINLRRRNRSLEVISMAEWEDGAFLGQPDSACLHQAAAQGLTLVTYDRRTIFVDEKTISPPDVGGLVRSLNNLWAKTKKWDWANRVCFLRR
jgi:hypothetical protein